MKEENLIKILEYGRSPLKQALSDICTCLNLEFYFEENPLIYTISSEFFVLDIANDTCSLIFVEGDINSKLPYIQAYLTYFLSNRLAFYQILKYLNSCNKTTKYRNLNQSCTKFICFCSCLYTNEYCQVYDLSKVSESFNIFTHSEFKYPYEVYLGGKLDFKINAPNNFADIFRPENFSKQVFNYFLKSNAFIYEADDVKVIDKSVFISGKRSQIASFSFLKGCTLTESLEFDKVFNT